MSSVQSLSRQECREIRGGSELSAFDSDFNTRGGVVAAVVAAVAAVISAISSVFNTANAICGNRRS